MSNLLIFCSLTTYVSSTIKPSKLNELSKKRGVDGMNSSDVNVIFESLKPVKFNCEKSVNIEHNKDPEFSSVSLQY